ncbi:Protein of uncharacterised function (DUF3499) [Dermatophilus congolensis]|uniref:Protein of uncharacterized function (DUF3499) n=1 Tax=Dermatophilus congolensis TaxID=1863 RepID=A0AA46BME2_9MICO|nr:Protein of uncharacterised function (DUF3499) [Dermatophilus congolensis]
MVSVVGCLRGFKVEIVPSMRRCTRTACGRRAVATLTYNYADSTAVLGALSTYAEPHSYDLCPKHAERLTAPQGWEVVRLIDDFESLPDPTDDLTAVADAVRDADVWEQATRHAAQEDRALSRYGRSRRDVAVGGEPLTSRTPRLRVLRDSDVPDSGR